MSLEQTLSESIEIKKIDFHRNENASQRIRTKVYSGYHTCEQYVENINDDFLTRWQYGLIDENKVWKEGDSLSVILLSRVLPQAMWVTAEFNLGRDKIKAQVVGIDRVRGEVLVSWANEKGENVSTTLSKDRQINCKLNTFGNFG
jgi:hypothetical protein